MIVCELELIDRRLTVRILDHGPGFVPARTAQPEWSADDLTTVLEGGFGILIIQHVFAIVRTIPRQGEFGLEITLTF